jgi:hypothetical protein
MLDRTKSFIIALRFALLTGRQARKSTRGGKTHSFNTILTTKSDSKPTVFPPPGIAIDELAGHRMRRRSATDRTRRPARSHRRQTNGSGALRRTPPPSPSPLDPPTPRHPPPLRNSQGGGGTLGGELRLGPTLPRPTGYVPRPPSRYYCAPGAHVNTTPRGLRTYRQAWLAQTTKARPPDMPGFTPEPPGSHRSFALQRKPQSERPLLRGSTSTTCQFNYNTTNIYFNSNTRINIIRPHPATLAPGGFRRARNALKLLGIPSRALPSHGAANARHGQTLS